MMTPKNTEQYTILLVDDAPEELKALISFLEKSGFRISAAHSGKAALNRIDSVQPDIILLDVLMPDMDGFETCRHLKEQENTREIPVIFMTALAETVNKVKGFDMGGVDFLTKPVQHKEVLARVNAHLTIQKLQRQLQEQNVRLEKQNTLLAEQNERFRTLSEAAFEGILIHDDGHIIEVNQAIERMFGYQRADLPGKNVLEFVTPEFREIALEHIRTKNEHPYKAEGIRQDGSNFPIEIQAKTMPYEGREARVVSVRDMSWRKALEEEKQQILSTTIRDRYKFGEIIGKSHTMQEVYQTIVNISASDANVLICGESGTGKELVAHTIHQLSERKKQAFVPVNCGAIPETLFESEFFGYRKGAFTGAAMHKPGIFDQAHQGTLFLDEVGELTPAMQVKLLRVLQDGEYMPLGATLSKKVDVRLIAATNKDLTEQLHQGTIREDFFYRIRVIVINLPPLRDRKEDIPLLIEHFLKKYSRDKEGSTIPARIIEALCVYHWPGNVRELQNELKRYLTERRLEFIGNVLPTSAERNRGNSQGFDPQGMTLWEAVETLEKSMIVNALTQHNWQQGKAAKLLGISEKTLYNKMGKYGLKSHKDFT